MLRPYLACDSSFRSAKLVPLETIPMRIAKCLEQRPQSRVFLCFHRQRNPKKKSTRQPSLQEAQWAFITQYSSEVHESVISPLRDVWSQFQLPQLGCGGKDYTSFDRLEARDAAYHPVMNSIAPTTKEDVAPNTVDLFPVRNPVFFIWFIVATTHRKLRLGLLQRVIVQAGSQQPVKLEGGSESRQSHTHGF